MHRHFNTSALACALLALTACNTKKPQEAPASPSEAAAKGAPEPAAA